MSNTRPDSRVHRFNDRPATIIEQLAKIDRAITAPQLARLFAVSPISIYRQAKAGRLPSFRIGTSLRFDPGAVGRWLQEK